MWGFHDGMGWWMVFGGFWMLVFWAAIIGLVVRGMNRISRRDDRDHTDSPVEIAKRRLARGELTASEYEELTTTLS